ncbi:hypothetical protein [Microbacterium sp. gxy059]|uniref:hypothetical protein n=1 Tax=Microbacterium sp. gxy059 TaxID=2957199 RepID=UPI003D984F52
METDSGVVVYSAEGSRTRVWGSGTRDPAPSDRRSSHFSTGPAENQGSANRRSPRFRQSAGMPIEAEHLRTWSHAALRAEGHTRADIRRAVSEGRLFHARRDNYVEGTASDAIKSAVRVGGRLDCVSLMRELGVFVLQDDPGLHVQIERGRHWLRAPRSRSIRLRSAAHRVVTHWRVDDAAADSTVAYPVAALAQAVRCQTPRAAIATLDSAVHRGIIRGPDLSEVFERLPERLQRLRAHIDGRAESGPETFARLIVRSLGVDVELQVVIDGVGRVDLLIDGWIIVECDSRAHHGGWEEQERDRSRDLAAAARGFATIRPTARQIFEQPHLLRESVQGLLTGAAARPLLLPAPRVRDAA